MTVTFQAHITTTKSWVDVESINTNVTKTRMHTHDREQKTCDRRIVCIDYSIFQMTTTTTNCTFHASTSRTTSEYNAI